MSNVTIILSQDDMFLRVFFFPQGLTFCLSVVFSPQSLQAFSLYPLNIMLQRIGFTLCEQWVPHLMLCSHLTHLLQSAQLCPATPITQTLHTHSGRLPTERHPTGSCGTVKSRNYTWYSASEWLEEDCVFIQNRTDWSSVPFTQRQVMAELCALSILSWELEALLVESPTTQFKEQLSSFLHLWQSLLLVCQLSYYRYLRELLYLEIIK